MSLLKKVTDASLPYLVSFPPGAAAGQKLPVLFFLHGRNLCAEPDAKAADALELLKQDGIPSMLTHYGQGERTVAPTSDFDDASSLPNPAAVRLIAETFLTISPQNKYTVDKNGVVQRDDARWAVGSLRTFVKEMLQRYKGQIDESRIYLTGLSMGGGGTWSLALAEPNLFTAILPICAGGNAARVSALKDLPTWCHMGTKDDIVPIKMVDELMDAMRKVQPDVGYSRYPLFPHQIWSGVYSDMRVWKWLLSHKKGGAKL